MKNMKKMFLSGVLLTVLVLTACSKYEGEFPAGEKSDELPEIMRQSMASEEAIAENHPYDSIIAAYTKAFKEEWDAGKMMDEGLNYLFAVCIQDDPRATVGYWQNDINGDGIEELLICANSESVFYSSLIFDLYTIKNGVPTLVFQSSERNTYYWCGDNTIDNSFSSGATQSGRHICSFDGERLKLMEGVEYDAASEEQGPWYRVGGNEAETIPEDDANALLQKYNDWHIGINMTLFLS